jgi:homoserine O-acetyltransferase/O-succinyltransferase
MGRFAHNAADEPSSEPAMILRALFGLALTLAASATAAQTTWPNQQDGDYIINDFRFGSGETLPELRLHYRTLGTAKRNAQGEIINGVVLLHGTSGSGNSWLLPSLADELYGKGQPLDAAEHFIIIPDSIGVGGSSKPSDGLRAKFPHYRYADIVRAEQQLVTQHLNVRHLRLVLGSSMGGMQTWMWGEMYPDLMDGLVPIASQPIGISGRNWILRRIRIEAIKNDPEYNGGNYTKNPSTYVYTLPMAAMNTENVVRIQEMAPTREAGDEMYKRLVEEAKKGDANNTLYGIEAVMDYDPSKDLEKIKARLLAINFEDDEGNPPELGVLDPAIKRIKNARHVVIPAGPESHGHYSHLRAKLWKSHLAEFMKTLPKQ